MLRDHWPTCSSLFLSSTQYHDRSWRKAQHSTFGSHVNRRKRQNCQSVESCPSLKFGKTALFCVVYVRYHVTYRVTFSRKQHLMDCWRFFSRIIKHLLKYNFVLENSWPWPLRALEGLSDVFTTVQSAVSHWEFGLDPSMAQNDDSPQCLALFALVSKVQLFCMFCFGFFFLSITVPRTPFHSTYPGS